MTCTFTRLRDGDDTAPLFLFPGAGSDPRELLALASSMRSPRAILGADMLSLLREIPTPAAVTVGLIADSCFREIVDLQKRGPYFLAGYSFGGLVAIEVARLLKGSGKEVGLLGLIDAIFDHRYWPKRLFLSAQARRIYHHANEMRALPVRMAVKEFDGRLRRLVLRLRDRLAPSVSPTATALANDASPEGRCVAAMRRYVPSPYPGDIVIFKADAHADFACDLTRLWRELAETVESETIGGSHLGILREISSISKLAAALDVRLDYETITAAPACSKSGQPKVLILAALRWLPVMRLALELSEVGFTVEAACPGGYQIENMAFVKASYRYNAIASISLLRDAIVTSRPMLLVPCDDYVTRQLHDLYRMTRPSEPDGSWLRTLIASSLGEPSHFALLYSRYGIGSLARELELTAPATEAVGDRGALVAHLSSLGLPVVLKSDGSWGGRGVVVAQNEAEALRAFRKLSAPPSVLRTLKRLVLDRDPTLVLPCLRRRRPAVSAQHFVPGRPANAAVACWRGKVLAAVLVEVLESNGATGPATVVRVISHQGMSDTVQRMVERLKLSGLCGFDFVLRTEDGTAQLVEINPRATPTCHLIALDGKDLLAALYGALQGLQTPPRGYPRLEPLALFPQAQIRDPGDRFPEATVHDIPWKSPELVKLAQVLRDRKLSLSLPLSLG